MRSKILEIAERNKELAKAAADVMGHHGITVQTYAEGEEGQAVLDFVQQGISDGVELLLQGDITNHPALAETIGRLKALREMEMLLKNKPIFREDAIEDAGSIS